MVVLNLLCNDAHIHHSCIALAEVISLTAAWLSSVLKVLVVNTAGAPSALESQIRQLDRALDESRFQMQQTENIIRSKTPTGPELDSTYRGYVSILSLVIPACTWES